MKTKDGFYKSQLDGNHLLDDNYVLLAGGGHRQIGNAINNLPISNSQMNVGLFAQYAREIKPLHEKQFTYTCGANDQNSGYIYFGNVKPSSNVIKEPYWIRYRLTVKTSDENTQGEYDCLWCVSGESIIYKMFNTFYSGSYYPIYSHSLIYHKNSSTSSNRNSYPGKIGVRVQSASQPTTLQRTYIIKIYECFNCTFEFFNDVTTYSSAFNSTYHLQTTANGTSYGLQESGDSTNIDDVRLYYTRLKVGSNGIMQYSLVMQKANGEWESFTSNSGTGTSKTKNTSGFKLGSRIYYYSNSSSPSNNITGLGTIRAYCPNIDFRYSCNCGTNLEVNKPLYIVGTINQNDGLFYLDDNWYTQTEPIIENGKIYIRICEAVYSTNSGDLISDGYAYWYKKGVFRRYYQPYDQSYLFVGPENTRAYGQASNPYIKLFNDNNLSNQYSIIGGTNITVTSDGNGNIKIDNTYSGSAYLPLAGGTMTGTITWANTTALPQNTSPSLFLTVTANTNGVTNYSTKANVLQALTGLTSTAVGSTSEPVYWTGTTFAKSSAIHEAVTGLFIGKQNTKTIDSGESNPYIKLFDDNTLRNQYQIIGDTNITVTSDISGNIIISNTYSGDKTYLKLSGGQMTGNISWKNETALPQDTSPQYFLTITAFANGGNTKWASKANTLKALTGLTSNAVGNSSTPIYWDGTKFATSTAIHEAITGLFIGKQDTKANGGETNPYIKIFDDNTLRNQYQIIGDTGIEVKSDGSGNINIKNIAPNIDEKVTQNPTTTNDNYNYEILFSYTASDNTKHTEEARKSNSLLYNPSSKLLSNSGIIQGTQLKSTIATGTAPLVVASTTLVSNLNADLLDGIHANGLLTAASLGANGNNTTLSVTVGGTTKTGSVTVPFATNAGNADLLDGIHAKGLLTAASLGANGNNTTLSVTVGGTTKTGSVTVPFATNTDLLDEYHAIGINTSGNYIIKQAYINPGDTSSVSGDPWYRIAVFSANASSNNRKALLYIARIMTGGEALVEIEHRGNSATDYVHTLKLIIGDISTSDLRLYYGEYNQTIELWIKVSKNTTGNKSVHTRVLAEYVRAAQIGNYITLDNTLVTTFTYSNYVECTIKDFSGNAATATKLATTRNLRVNLATSNSQQFNGTADATSIGVYGILPFANLPAMKWADQSVAASVSNDTTPRFLRIGLGLAVDASYSINASSSIRVASGGHIRIDTAGASGANNRANYISAGPGYSANSGRYGVKVLACDQSDCQSGMGQDVVTPTGWTNVYNFSLITGNNSSDLGYISFASHKVNSTTYRYLGGFRDNAGTITFQVIGAINSSGFHHTGHDNNDSVLLAGGSYKALSELSGSHTHNYINSSGFTNNGTTSLSSWGQLTTANGYTGILNINDASGGSWEIAYKGGQQFHQIDGYYYQNEGRYRVTDVSETVTALSTNGNYLTWTKNGSTSNITIPYATNADLLDSEHAYQIRALPKNNSSVIFSALPYLENNIKIFDSTPVVSMENAPEGKCFGPINSHKQFETDYILVQPGEVLYGEIWAYRASGSTGDAGTLYYGVKRFDRNKKPISANVGLNAPNNGYFVASGVTVPSDGVWHKYSATQEVPTTHTIYDGSDGKGTYYVKAYVIVNYSAGTIPTYIGRILLKRLNQEGQNGYIATTPVKTLSTPNQNITGTGNITPYSSGNYSLGSTSLYWNWAYIDRICLNRSSNANYGRIYFYAPTYYTWVDYMSLSVDGGAPTGGKPSTTTEVTGWARRSLIENTAGQGWIWESCANASVSSTTKPSAKMSLSSNTGILRIEANASSTTNNTGGLIVSSVANGSQGNTAIELWRGTNASWMISNEGGTFHIRDNYTTAAQTTYLHDNLQIAYNTGQLKTKEIVPFTTNTYNLGTTSLRWYNIYYYGSAIMKMAADTSNAKSPIQIVNTSDTLIAEIGYHNTGDTNGAFVIVPYSHSGTDFSSGGIGLYIGKNNLKWENKYILRYSATATSGKVIVSDGTTGNVKTSAYSLSATINSGTENRIAWYKGTNEISSGTATTDGAYLGNVSYLSVNTAHQTNYRLYVSGTSYHTGTIYAAGQPAIQTAAGTGNWNYIRMHNGSNYWDIATKSNANSGALDFRPGGVDNRGPYFSTNGMANFNTISIDNANYGTAAIQIREYHYGGAQTNEWTYAPRIAWHWSGRVAAQIGLANDGYLYEAPLTATNFYRIVIEKSDIKWGINVDKLDGTQKSGLLTDASLGSSGNSTTLSVTVGDHTETGSITVPYATNAGNADTVDTFHINQWGYPYKYYKTITCNTTLQTWYVKLFVSGYAQWKYFIINTSYNNCHGPVMVRRQGFFNAIEVECMNTNGNHLQAVCYDSCYHSTDHGNVIYLKFDAIQDSTTSHYSPSESATLELWSDIDFTMTLLGTTEPTLSTNRAWLNLSSDNKSYEGTTRHHGNIIPNVTNTFTLGTSSLKWANIYATTFTGNLSGNASTATKLATPRAINGTNFDGSAAITTANWGTTRTITIGNTAKTYNGSGNITWTLAEIGVATAAHNHGTNKKAWGQTYVDGDGNLQDINGNLFIDTGDNDRYIHFRYNTSNYAGASWRLISRGSGSSDTNYFDIETGGSDSSANTWYRVIRLTMDNRYVGIGTDSPTQRLHVSGGLLAITNNSNTVTIGSANNGWCHITNSANINFYFNKGIHVVGDIWEYNTNYGIASTGYFYAKGVYANRDGSGTLGGVALYSNTDPMTYGIAFRSTTYGKLGKVQGDWATYLTMSDHENRGWVFRSGSTNYASISARGEAYFNAIGKDGYISYPNGGHYLTVTSTITGAICIELPVSWCSTMFKFEVDIYNYVQDESITYIVGGYNYEGSSSWYNTTAYSLRYKDNYRGNFKVRFGHNGTHCCIYIGEIDSTWNYPKIIIRNILIGQNNCDYNKWASGWNISFVTSFDTITISSTIENPAVNYLAQIANKLGTTTVGSGTRGIYLNNGTPSPISFELKATVNNGTANTIAYYSGTTTISSWTSKTGDTNKPIYLNNGVPTAINATVGSSAIDAIQPVFLSAGTITAASHNAGGTAKPVYVASGVIKPISATVGSSATDAIKPVFLNAGTITASSHTSGSTTKPVFVDGGVIKPISGTVGSSTKGVFLSSGTITAMSHELKATVNEGTANRMTWYNNTKSITSANSIYTNGTKLAINSTTEPTEILYANGDTKVGGDLRVVGNDQYFGSSSGSQCHVQYDNTNRCIKIMFD